MHDVIVVGAGVAGLAAAGRLLEAGCSVLLLDKARSPGGRCATRRLAADQDSAWMDTGAQYLTASDTEFSVAVEAWQSAGVLRAWTPQLARGMRREDGIWVLEPSPDERPRWVGRGGLNGWARHWHENLVTAGLESKLSCQIRSACPDGGGWRLADSGGNVYRSRALVVAVPPEQALGLLRGVPLPPPPDARLQPCLAVMVSAPARLAYDAVFIDSPSLQWAANNTSKTGRVTPPQALWTLHSTPGLAEQALAGDESEVVDRMRRDFADLMALDEIQVGRVHTHLWRYARREADRLAGQASWAVAPLKLALAGDWLADGRIEGAWLSGRAAAADLLQGGMA